MASEDFDEKGRFKKGHKNLGGGRPPNAVNKITKSLREQVLEGFGNVPKFVQELKKDYPPAAAGLLARMMPSGDAELASSVGSIKTVNMLLVPRGNKEQIDALAENRLPTEFIDAAPTLIEPPVKPKLVIDNESNTPQDKSA